MAKITIEANVIVSAIEITCQPGDSLIVLDDYVVGVMRKDATSERTVDTNVSLKVPVRRKARNDLPTLDDVLKLLKKYPTGLQTRQIADKLNVENVSERNSLANMLASAYKRGELSVLDNSQRFKRYRLPTVQEPAT